MMRKRAASFVLCLCMVLSLLPVPAKATSRHPFTDVSSTDWFNDNVQYVYEHNLMTGTTATTFSPYRTTSRGMLVTILYRLEGSPIVNSDCPFPDVSSGRVFEKPITWAAENGIVTGYASGNFGPDDTLTRQQMAAILYRYSDNKGYDIDASANLDEYTDSDNISNYAKTAMAWANAKELINGTSDKALNPAGNASRAQTAAILSRFCINVVPPDNGGSDSKTATDDSSETSDSSVTEMENCTVTFDLNYTGADSNQTSIVKKGEKVSPPVNPSRNNYDFLGWYTASKGGRKFDFDSAVTADTTLYARWSIIKSSNGSGSGGGSGGGGGSGSSNSGTSNTAYLTVSFNTNGGNTIVSQNVTSGTYASRPSDPTREGHIFKGWFSDAALTTVYDFNTPVTANLTLYAKWDSIFEDSTWEQVSAENEGLLYSVSNIDVEGNNVTATVNTIHPCVLEVIFYSQDEDETIASIVTDVDANLEMSAVSAVLQTPLPQYFVAEATLKDGQGQSLCDSYKTYKFTKRYEEFEAKTVDDFPDSIVMNLDEETTSNFAVLKDNVRSIVCTDDANTCSFYDGVYTFINANSDWDDVSVGDALAILVEGEILTTILVATISREEGTVAVTPATNPTIQDIYQYIKIDIQETATEFYQDTDISEAQLNYMSLSSSKNFDAYALSLPSNFDDGGNLVKLQSATWVDELKEATRWSDTINPSFSRKVETTLEKELTKTVSIEGTLSVSVEYAFKFSYDIALFGDKYVDVEFSAEAEGTVGVGIKAASKDDTTKDELETFKLNPEDVTIEFGKYFVPTPIPDVFVTLNLNVPVKFGVAGELSIETGLKYTAGYKYHCDVESPLSLQQTLNKYEKKETWTNKVTLNAEGSMSCGLRLAVGVSALSIISGELSGEIGGKLKISTEKVLSGSTTEENIHLCDLCFAGKYNAYLTVQSSLSIGFQLPLIDELTWKTDWTLFNLEFQKKKFYFSLDKLIDGDEDFFGWNKSCPNRSYRTTIAATYPDDSALSEYSVRVVGTNADGAFVEDVESDHVIYLKNGDYTAYVTTGDGAEYTGSFIVSSEAQVVSVEVPMQETVKRRSAVVPDLYRYGEPQILFFDNQGRVEYCVKLFAPTDTGDTYYSVAYVMKFNYEDGKLVSSKAIWGDKSPSHMSGIYGSYDTEEAVFTYVGDLIEAKTPDGYFLYKMDSRGNIVRTQGDSETYEDITYIDNAEGQIVEVRRIYTAPAREINGSVYNPSYDERYFVTYDSNGNITGFADGEYTYNADSQMVSWNGGGYGAAHYRPWTFTYNQDGEISSLHMEGTEDGYFSGADYRFSYERDGDYIHVIMEQFVWGDVDGERWIRIEFPSGTVSPNPPTDSDHDYGTIIEQGECGTNSSDVIWTMYDSNTLVISGNGHMADFSTYVADQEINLIECTAPWYGKYAVNWSNDQRVFIQNVVVKEGVTSIGADSFALLVEMQNVVLPHSLKRISDGAFSDCDKLANIAIPNNVESIGEWAFSATGLTSITIPDGVKSVGRSLFSNCRELTSVTVSSTMTNIPEDFCAFCPKLNIVRIPVSVLQVEIAAFAECNNLRDIYYGGNESQWTQIDIDRDYGNSALSTATIHYDSRW